MLPNIHVSGSKFGVKKSSSRTPTLPPPPSSDVLDAAGVMLICTFDMVTNLGPPWGDARAQCPVLSLGGLGEKSCECALF